jgi:pyruvate dehydrogenase E1 component alpha subunit
MDVREVFRDASEAVERARTESMPGFLEIQTYRYRGHSMSDPARYRSAEELESYKKQDPLLILKDALEAAGELSAEEYAAMDGEAKAACDEAVRFAEESPEPEDAALYEHVFVNPIPHR